MLVWILEDHNISKYFAFKALIGDFLKNHPEINLKFSVKSRKNMWKSIFSFLKSPSNNIMADIVEIPHNWVNLFAKIGVLLEVKHYYQDFDIETYPDFIKKGLFVDGNYLFSIPLWFEIITLQYRVDMLKDLIKDKNMSFLSWDDFIFLCGQLKKKNRKKEFYPLDNFNSKGIISSQDVLSSVLNRSQGFFLQDFAMSNITKEEVIAGIEDFILLAERKYLPLFQESFYEMGFLKTGLSAMSFSWRLPDEFKKIKLHAVPFPQIRRKENIVRSFNLAVSSSSREIDECGIFIKWLLKKENQNYFCKTLKVFNPCKKEFDEIASKYSIYSNLYPTLKLIPDFFIYPTFEIIMDDFLFDICRDIVQEKYSRENLIKGLIMLKGEIDYLLSNYPL